MFITFLFVCRYLNKNPNHTFFFAVCGTQFDMKSPPAATDECDDIFGPPRTYANGYCPPKNRPSMISAKYRQKEERRKVLKISISKLKKIEDPEASLCRSVLINNTMKRLQKEARDEKIQKQQLNYPRCYDNDNFLNIKSEFIKNELKASTTFEEQSQDFTSSDAKLMDSLKADFAMESEFDSKMAEEINASAKNIEVLNVLVEENFSNLNDNFATNNNSPTNNVECLEDSVPSRKRSFDDMEDCDVQDVLSQFYMPPTPRMLTCIDDDEDVNVVDDEPLQKRAKSDDGNCLQVVYDSSKSEHFCASFEATASLEMDKVSVCGGKTDDAFRVNSFINNNIPETESRLRYTSQNMETENAFSCGHASMFNELQSNVFHSLIASLET